MTKRELVGVACAFVASRAMAQTTVTISTPPPTGAVHSHFSVTETVWNGGTGATGGGTQTLSLVPVGGGGAVLTLGTRGVPGLASGGLSTATTQVTIPAGTPSGTYVIGAGSAGCGGNCLKSLGTIAISTCPAGPLGCVSQMDRSLSPGARKIAPEQVMVKVQPKGISSYMRGKVSGGLESNFYHGPYFENCLLMDEHCGMMVDVGSVIVFSAATVFRPTEGAIPAHNTVFIGWSGPGCAGTPVGTPNSHAIRVVVAHAPVTCFAEFQ